MNQQEKIKVGEMWIGLAQMYGKDIPAVVMKLMLDAISDLDAMRVLQCMNHWAMNSKIGRHPLPAEIREFVFPKLDPKDAGREVALRIREAVTKYGWNNATPAREHIGESGWGVIERMGGWLHICENLGAEIQETTFMAQCRDAVESGFRLKEQGFNPDRPAIEQNKTRGLEPASGILTRLLNKQPTEE
jgi:hypothetical protein